MNIALVWLMVSYSGAYAGFTGYSPPLASLADCQRIQETVKERMNTKCVQVYMVFK